jgi:hypothetical protein
MIIGCGRMSDSFYPILAWSSENLYLLLYGKLLQAMFFNRVKPFQRFAGKERSYALNPRKKQTISERVVLLRVQRRPFQTFLPMV